MCKLALVSAIAWVVVAAKYFWNGNFYTMFLGLGDIQPHSATLTVDLNLLGKG